MKTLYLALVMSVFLCSCAPKVTTSIISNRGSLEYDTPLHLLGIKDTPPKDAVLIGKVSVGDTGFSVNCGFDVALSRVQEEARKVGANIVHIKKHKFPNPFGSSCHRISADLLYSSNITTKNGGIETDADYATLYVYRFGGMGSAVSYDLHLDDNVITRVRNNYGKIVTPIDAGNYTLWASTEAKSAIPITIENGKTYYIRCGISMRVLVGQPTIELIDPSMGVVEFMSIKNVE